MVFTFYEYSPTPNLARFTNLFARLRGGAMAKAGWMRVATEAEDGVEMSGTGGGRVTR